VLESGFAWNGGTYESLSKVARAITGTNWNGPRFFGLRDRHERHDEEGAGSRSGLRVRRKLRVRWARAATAALAAFIR